MEPLPYLTGYSPELVDSARTLLARGELLKRVEARYPDRHQIRSSKQLGAYVQELKGRYLKRTPPLNRVLYDDKLDVVQNALGLHTTKVHPHGGRVHKRRELRVAGLFRDVAPEFLRMIVVHELAHQKHADHDSAFYRLCEYMEPDYQQLEFDLRLLLTAREHAGES